MYGLVGVVLVGLGLVVFSRFYDVTPLARPGLIVAGLLVAFAGSIALRLFRSRRHARAHRHEYDRAPRRGAAESPVTPAGAATRTTSTRPSSERSG
jgi:hypothetical protein